MIVFIYKWRKQTRFLACNATAVPSKEPAAEAARAAALLLFQQQRSASFHVIAGGGEGRPRVLSGESLQENGSLFWSFPYVCPEPVLVE